MATGLASQLRALASAPGRDNHTEISAKTRTRASLLFDPREAADVDLQTVFAIAQAGLDELVLLNKAFASFRKTLFSAQSTQTDRELETKEFNDKLNASIAEFLRLLSVFILRPPAHQVLEYLIRRYKVHVYNVDDILLSFLPFHETSIFVRVVQLLKTEQTRWEFLKGVKHSGAPPPRNVLVQRCTHDMSFLGAVCDSGIAGANMKSATHTTFSSVTVLETASTIPSVTKEFVNKLLPFILHAFEKGVPEEFRAGGLLIVGVLASRASLTSSLCSAILEAITKAASSSSSLSTTRLFLMAVIEVIQTQELDSFPPKAFKYLVKVKDLAELLGALVETYVADKFISLFLQALCEHCVKGVYYQNLFCEMIASLPLKDHLKLIVSGLLKSHLDQKREGSNLSASALQKPFSALEKRFPEELELCINNISKEQAPELFETLCEVLEGSLREPLEGTGCSIYTSVNHSQAGIRKAAVEHIITMCEKPLKPEEEAFVSETLVSRLLDSDLEVVRAVLRVKNLEKHVPLGSLFTCFETIIHRCMSLLRKGPKASKKDAKDVVKACLKLLESWSFDERSLKEIRRCSLCYVLLEPKTWRLNLKFLKLSSRMAGSLFKFLPDGDLNEGRDSEILKEQACSWRSQMNSKIVKAFAAAVDEDQALVELLIDAALANENAKLLTCLVILKCLSGDSSAGLLHQLSGKCFEFLRDEWASLAPALETKTPELSKLRYDSPPNEVSLYYNLDTGIDVYPEVILFSLFKLIPNETKSVNDLFLLFAGSPAWGVFKPHIHRVLELLSGDKLLFLSEYSCRQELPALVRVHSLNILAWYIAEHLGASEKQCRLSLACSFVALASSVKSLRVAAVSLVKALQKAYRGSNEALKTLLQSLVSSGESLVDDGKFMASFCGSFFVDDQKAGLLTGLIEDGLMLPLAAQTIFFDALRGVSLTREKAAATQSTLSQLLERRKVYHLTSTSSSPMALSEQELELLEKLLEINLRDLTRNELEVTRYEALLETLNIDGGSLDDPVVVQPCLLAMSFVSPELYNAFSSEFQDKTFESLIELSAAGDNKVHPAAVHTIDKLEIKAATITKHIESLCSNDGNRVTPKKKKKRVESGGGSKSWPAEEKIVPVSVGLLEYLLRRTKALVWDGLLGSLFDLLRAHASGLWLKPESSVSPDEIQNAGQLLLSVIENVLRSSVEQLQDYASALDVSLLVKYVESKNSSTRNQALAVITVAGKLHPESLLEHVVGIISTVCSSAVIEDDNHSHTVVQEMLESLVPFWLSKLKGPQTLFQVFLEALPTIPSHRQTDLIKCVLRVTNEETSLPAFLVLLVRQARSEDDWPISFAKKLSMSYDSQARISAIVKVFSELHSSELRSGDELSWNTMRMTTRFVVDQLRRLEQHQFLEGDTAHACRALMEQALLQLQMLGDKQINLPSELRASCLEAARSFQDMVTKLMSPAMFCKTVACLLESSENSICKMVLKMYISKLKEQETLSRKKAKTSVNIFTIDLDAHLEIVRQISKLLVSSEASSHRTKQAAASALDITIQRLGSKCSSSFVSCLPAVLSNFREEENEALVVASIRCTASIISAAGSECLPSLPAVMSEVLKVAQGSSSGEELELGVLQLLEAAVEKLGAFLSPYIEGIIQLLTSPKYVSLATTPQFSRVQTLVSENLPARLLLDPLMSSYPHTLQTSEASACVLFQLLGAMCSKLDRAGVSTYHAKIFKFCMEAFDLRRKHPESFTSVHLVEDSVISAVGALVMKLSETAFRPLFVAVQEWSSASVFNGEAGERSVERSIVFYKLVNHLASRLRSVFVPYFRYVLEECLLILGSSEGTKTGKSKRKKSGHLPAELSGGLPKWHLRYLVVSALHKCFLYDSIGFLDSARFQQLLQPLASQLLEHAPQLSDASQGDIPSVAEADDTLVSCLGRMALASGSDLLWKPLNHEVLMKTRGDNGRAKLLALRIVKFLSENLKEEYLVLVPETIPFLSELLEDQDLEIVSKTQEVIKLLEEASGESLAEFL